SRQRQAGEERQRVESLAHRIDRPNAVQVARTRHVAAHHFRAAPIAVRTGLAAREARSQPRVLRGDRAARRRVVSGVHRRPFFPLMSANAATPAPASHAQAGMLESAAEKVFVGVATAYARPCCAALAASAGAIPAAMLCAVSAAICALVSDAGEAI